VYIDKHHINNNGDTAISRAGDWASEDHADMAAVLALLSAAP
jgi:hypothetical protein